MFNSGIRGRRAKDGEGINNPQAKFVQTTYPQPSISSYSITGFDDTALDPAGGQTIVVTGTGFVTGVSATLGGTQIGAVSLVSPTQISFTSPAKSAGTYSLLVYNSTGGAAILVPGITYSSFPTFTTAAGSIGSLYETKAINTSVVATSDSAITYSLVSGSLPAGATLASNGTITGTAPADSGSTTYTFSVKATDAELQDVTRTFTLTVNTDVVTWVTPSSGATINLDGTAYTQALSATDAAGYSVSYTANTLPTGLTLSSGTISGTPTVDATTTTLLTATAATTNRTATNTVTWVVSLGDAYWKNTVLQLSGSANLQTSSFITDNSINNSQLTVSGDTKAQSFHPYQLGYYSNSFNGSTDNIVVTASSAFTFGTSDFTIEFWMYANAVGAADVVATYRANTSGDWQFYLDSSAILSYYPGGASTYGTSQLVLGRWYHIAGTRQGDTVRFFVNGALAWTSTGWAASSMGANQTVQVGAGAIGVHNDGFFNGFVSNLRIVKGTALYTATFTPSTSPLLPINGTVLLTCQSNRFVDNSPISSTITPTSAPKVNSISPFLTSTYVAGTQYYSATFDGTGDYLSIADTTNLQPGTGDFTYEFWFYPRVLGTTEVLSKGYGVQIYTSTTAILAAFSSSNNGTYYINASFGSIVVNTWYHIAVTRSGNNYYGWLNGSSTLLGTSASSPNTGTDPVLIGTLLTYYINGLVSNVRFVKGTAAYTNTFTPSTTPLTAISGTQLLTCQDSTFKDNSTNAYAVTTAGDTKPVAVSPFTPNSYTGTRLPTTYGSAYFDGTSDVVTLSAGKLPQLGTSNFTMEAWVYTTTVGTGAAGIFDMWNGGQTAFLLRRNTADIQFYVQGGSNIGVTSMVANTWIHYAVVRNGTTITLYQNGIAVGTPISAYSTSITNTAALGIGGTATTGSECWTGYISDARIVVGTALYTSNFLPQFTSPLTAVTNTQLLTLQTNGSHNTSVIQDNSGFNNLITRFGDTNVGTFTPYGDTWSVLLSSSSGTTNSIGLPATSNNTTGTSGDFTIECWAMKQGNSGLMVVAMISGTTTSFCRFNSDGSAGGLASWSTAQANHNTFAPFGTWFHMAACRNNGTMYTYINGVMVNSTSDTTNYTLNGGSGSSSAQIGNYNNSTGQEWIGFISNFRIVNGTAVYPGGTTFTPSTTPLRAITNTILLTCQSNRFVDNSPYNSTLTINAAPQVQKISPFSTVSVSKNYSMSFPATGSYYTGSNSNFNISATNVAWTFECWVFARASGGYFFAIGSGSAYGNGLAVTYGAGTASKFSFYQGNGSGANPVSITSTNTYNLNTWYHYAVTRTTAGVMTQYINGVADGTITYNAATVSTGTTFVINGLYDNNGLGNNGGNYAVSNIRFIINQSLYSGTFTPSTTQLTSSTVGSTGAGAAESITGTVVLLTAQNRTPIDNSGNNLTFTSVSLAAIIPVSPFSPPVDNTILYYSPSTNSGSIYYLGSTSTYISSPTNSLFAFGASNDFTAECWVYFTAIQASQSPGIISVANSASSTGWQIYCDPSSGWGVRSNAINIFTNANPPKPYQWYHVAYVRKSGTHNLYVNGIPAPAASSTAATWSDQVFYSGYTPIGNPMYGYVSDIRMFNGVAIYTSNFYPPTSPLTPAQTIGTTTYNCVMLANGTSNGIIDQTRLTNLETFGDAKVTSFSPYNGTYYSALFNGSTDYISIPTTSGNLDQTGDFTYDMWVYWLAMPTTGYQNISGQGAAGQSSYGLYAANASANTWSAPYVFKLNIANTGDILTGNTTLVAGQWYHLAHSRTSGVNRLFVNGVLQTNTYTDSTSRSFANNLYLIGQNSNCYISNFRYIKGTSLYTNTFTPPTVPSTAVTNTALLTCQSNKFVDNSTNAFAITLAGTPKVQTQNPFQINTGLSYYFDGTGDYLSVPRAWTVSNYIFTAGENFTIEAWIYPTKVGNQQIVGTQAYGANSDWVFALNSTNYPNMYFNSPSTTFTSTIIANVNQWTHVACVRSGGNTITVYVNGVSGATGTFATTTASNGTNGLSIGADGGANANTTFQGYITELRITRGYARYTSAFTPPTIPIKSK